MKALGALVNTNPYYVSVLADINVAQIETDQLSPAAQMNSLSDQDIDVALYSDTSIGAPSPLKEVLIAVNRIGKL